MYIFIFHFLFIVILSFTSKAISEVSWYEFRTMLEYKADWYGRNIVVAPTNYASSQLCSECGYKNIDVKNLALRE